MLSKEIKIMKIEKAWKFEGFCFVTDFKGKIVKRKCYERKTGAYKDKILINLDTDVFCFTWDTSKTPIVGKDIIFIGSYKSMADIEPKGTNEEEVPVAPKPVYKPDGITRHYKYDTIKACISAQIPVYLAGPAGSGKNHTLEQIAKDLELDFYFTNSVQQEYKITGFIDAGGIYHETEFYKAFTQGGLFFLDEMDASIPEVLVLLNAAIANGYFEFPTGKVTAHEAFTVVAAGNTVGSGANEQYTGRLVLDQATLDRFSIIEFDYDRNIEKLLAKGNMELVNFIRELRTFSEKQGIRTTFSYRCISMVVKLEGKLELKEIIMIAVVKGLDKDTINTLKLDGNTKYHVALKSIQGNHLNQGNLGW